MYVQPKKRLGQHFLKDKNIAQKIALSLTPPFYGNVLEIGPGTGVLTQYLEAQNLNAKYIEIDSESVDYLKTTLKIDPSRIIEADYLKHSFSDYFTEKYSVIGNFPYNISSQIFFRILADRDQIEQVVCMIQKEVADRIVSGPGNKTYGILSVLLQAYFNIKLLFNVPPQVFNPPPKVNSSVIRLERNTIESLPCNETLFTKVVKTSFNQRRKTLRNSLKSIIKSEHNPDFFSKRPEQLSVEQFIDITNFISKHN
jgi:16S rRNA (adenine1518-N6/adenine1519-N6)-dimethyltransferase